VIYYCTVYNSASWCVLLVISLLVGSLCCSFSHQPPPAVSARCAYSLRVRVRCTLCSRSLRPHSTRSNTEHRRKAAGRSRSRLTVYSAHCTCWRRRARRGGGRSRRWCDLVAETGRFCRQLRVTDLQSPCRLAEKTWFLLVWSSVARQSHGLALSATQNWWLQNLRVHRWRFGLGPQLGCAACQPLAC